MREKRKAWLETDFQVADGGTSGRWLPAILVRFSDHPVRLRVHAGLVGEYVSHEVSVHSEPLERVALGLPRVKRIERAPDALHADATALVAHYATALQAGGYLVDVADILRTSETLGYAIAEQRERMRARRAA